MAKPLSILFVTSEVVPFIKVGGIADVSFSLPLAVRDIGHDIRVMLPKYGNVSERKNRIHEINRLRDIPIPMGGKSSDPATVKSSGMNNPRTKVQAYITTSHKHFDSKKGVYENKKTGEPYPDNDDRFIFFSRSVIETCLTLEWFPDIIHCNDWQTALVPVLAKTLFPEEFKNTKFVFTVHSVAEQGDFPISTFQKTCLPEKLKKELTHKNKFNFLKAGLLYSDYVTTVSQTYADEITKDKKLTNGLSDVFSKLKNFKGILNGIDPWIWNPASDKLIKKKYTKNLAEYKSANKKSILAKFGFEYDEKVPLISMITRLNDVKGFPLLLEAADSIFKNDIKFVLLGDGSPENKKKLDAFVQKYPDKFAINIGFDEELAHRLEAGSDIFLMPSMTEPCGLNAIYSMAYGSIPIVRDTGGLSEIVTEIDEKKLTGNGFKFKNYKATDLMKALNKAIKFYEDPDKWDKIVSASMKEDYSWKKKVAAYDEVYNFVMK